MPVAGGWIKVLNKFKGNHVSEMQRFPLRRIVLLIDFDSNTERLSYAKSQIPEDLKDRVFVLGVLSEPERLRSDIKKIFEGIGETLANECFDDTNKLWEHGLLRHNKAELNRMILSVKPFLFD